MEVGVEDLHVAAFVAVVLDGDGSEGFSVLDGVGAGTGGDRFLRHVAGLGCGCVLGGEFDGLEFGVFFDEVIDLVAEVCGFDLGEWQALTEFRDETVVAFFRDVVAAFLGERSIGGEVEAALEMVNCGHVIFPLIGVDLGESVMDFGRPRTVP